jgi:hypothetical protein
VTAGTRLGPYGSGSVLSVRQRLGAPGRIGWALLGLVVAAVAIHGFRGFLPTYPGGDLLYHWGLTHGLLRGEFPPGGPYEGLPAYYPPGFHIALALIATILGITVEMATALLGVVWLPVLPLSTFVLARYLTGRAAVALVATTLTVFGGGYDFAADRLWVNSLFLVGHEAYPLYPRDIVFGLLPLGVYSFLRGVDGSAPWRWAALAGLLLGVCGLVQVQLLLPIPFALATVVIAVAVRRPEHRSTSVAVLAVTGVVTILLVGPWLIEIASTIRLNGGVALESAETLLPARIAFWDVPRQFGLVLPLALVGSGVAVGTLRERTTGVGWLHPRFPEAALVLVGWFAIPFVLAFLYDPGWPLEDALRPQRLWLLSSQPAAILAGIGLAWTADQVVAGRLRRPRLAAPLVAITLIVATVPTTFFTARLLSGTWTEPEYAHLRFLRDRVPDMASILATSGRRATVLTYEDWSSLAWYQTGAWVVAVKPPGYAKLAFDPGTFTGRSQARRRADVARAFGGESTALGSVASEYGAEQILLARRGDAWGVIHQVAATAAGDHGPADGTTHIVDGNGWDVVELSPGTRLAFRITSQGPVDLEMRFRADLTGGAVPARAFRLLAVGPTTDARILGEYLLPATSAEEWQITTTRVDLQASERLAMEAIDPVMIQSILGFVASSPPRGWHIARETEDAVLLERDR